MSLATRLVAFRIGAIGLMCENKHRKYKSGRKRLVVNQANLQYRLGLPAWAFPEWKNKYFDAEPSMLASYAKVFSSVEGNTTFYHIPSASSVDQWVDALNGSQCTVSFKLPSVVTHQRQPDEKALEQFLCSIKPLRDHLAPFLLQFPHWVGPEFLARFTRLFEKISDVGPAVIEVRNRDVFTEPKLLEPVLESFSFGRVMMDTRAIFQGDMTHPEVVAALHEKPDLPVLEEIYNNKVFVRLMLHPNGQNHRWIKHWALKTAAWIAEGVEPIIMIHCPNNLHCPAFAEEFHRCLKALSAEPLPEFPAWPIPQQGSLL